MKALQIVHVRNHGETNKEYLFLRATEDIANIHHYAVMDSTFSQQAGRSNLNRHFFQFPAKQANERGVKKGDLVIVHTHAGQDATNPHDDMRTWIHVYHMNLNMTIWNKSGDTATVLYCEVVDSKVV